MHFQNAALLSCLSAVSMTMPVKAPRDDHITLWEEDATCSSTGNQGVPGLLMAVDSNGAPVPCSEMEYASSSSGISCFVTTGEAGSNGSPIKCPGDVLLARDGPSDDDLKGIAEVLCSLQPGAAGVGSGQLALCSVLNNKNDPIEDNNTGLTSLCDTLFYGFCTFFDQTNDLIDPNACREDPNYPGLCDMANPGK